MKFSIKMTPQDLYEFSMHNSYKGAMGLFNLLFTAGAFLTLVFTWNSDVVTAFQRVILFFCCTMFTIIQPMMLKSKSKKQAEQTGFSAPVNLTITDDGIKVEQAGVKGELTWEKIWKVERIRTMMILKVGPSYGYLIPNRYFEEGTEKELTELLKRNLPAKKTKGLKG